MQPTIRYTLLASFTVAAALLSKPALGADTMEPFEIGASNLELYTNSNGIGRVRKRGIIGR